MIRRLLSFLALVLAAVLLSPFVFGAPDAAELPEAASGYLAGVPAELSLPNVVTGIVVTYRGLDTLGEVAVLFAATAAVGLLMKSSRHEVSAADSRRPASEILESGGGFLFPLIIVLGAYIFLHGHLTPGGGFQGGVVIATGFLLLLLSGRVSGFRHGIMALVESLSGFAYVSLALVGLFFAGGFLDPRFLPAGEYGRLFSAGAIPVIYSLIGLKVGAELVGILDNMRSPAGGAS